MLLSGLYLLNQKEANGITLVINCITWLNACLAESQTMPWFVKCLSFYDIKFFLQSFVFI